MDNNGYDDKSRSQNKPADMVRDGQYKVTFWRNEGENGDRISGKPAKTYTDREGNPRDTQSFSVRDMLPLSRLCEVAYERGRELEHELRQEQQQRKEHKPQMHESAQDNAREERRSTYRTKSQGNGEQRQPRMSRYVREQ